MLHPATNRRDSLIKPKEKSELYTTEAKTTAPPLDFSSLIPPSDPANEDGNAGGKGGRGKKGGPSVASSRAQGKGKQLRTLVDSDNAESNSGDYFVVDYRQQSSAQQAGPAKKMRLTPRQKEKLTERRFVLRSVSGNG